MINIITREVVVLNLDDAHHVFLNRLNEDSVVYAINKDSMTVKAISSYVDAIDFYQSKPEASLEVDGYEYQITEGPRKAWNGEPDLSKDGWEEYLPWGRFDYKEERYWRRKKQK